MWEEVWCCALKVGRVSRRVGVGSMLCGMLGMVTYLAYMLVLCPLAALPRRLPGCMWSIALALRGYEVRVRVVRRGGRRVEVGVLTRRGTLCHGGAGWQRAIGGVFTGVATRTKR